jgi:hypothetical protein
MFIRYSCCRPDVTLSSSESSLTISASDMGEGAAATVRKAKWGRQQVALKLFRGQPEHIYKELTAEAAILHVSHMSSCRAHGACVHCSHSHTSLYACRSSSVLALYAVLCRKPQAGARQRQLSSIAGSAKTSVSSVTSHDDALKDMVPQMCRPYGLVLECAPAIAALHAVG